MTILFHIDDKLVVTDNYDIVNTKTGEVIGKYYTNDFFENAEIWEDEHGEEKLEVHAEPLRKRSIRTIYSIEKKNEKIVLTASGRDKYGDYIKIAELKPVKNITLTAIRLRGWFSRVLSNILVNILLYRNPLPNIDITIKRRGYIKRLKPRIRNTTIMSISMLIYRYTVKYIAELVDNSIVNRYMIFTSSKNPINYTIVSRYMIMPRREVIEKFVNPNRRGHKASLIILAILYDFVRTTSIIELERNTIVLKNDRQLSTRSLRTQLYEFLKKHQL